MTGTNTSTTAASTSAGSAAATTVSGTPVPTSEIKQALTNAFDEVEAVEDELDKVAHEVAHWLAKEFHLIPKTSAEKTAAQNADAAKSA